MFIKKILLTITALCLSISLFAQKENKETLKKELSQIKSEIFKLEKKADLVQTKIDKQYGWKVNTFGTIGMNLSNFNNWYSNSKPNLSSGNITIIQNAYAKLNREKYFWVSYANVKLKWHKSYNPNKESKDKGFQGKADVFKITTLFGYKLTKKFAISGLLDYKGTFIKEFADPSFYDVGIGATYKPIEDFYIVVNPLNYEFVLAGDDKDYQSSMGAKFLIDYTHKFGKLNFNSNVVAFASYKSSDLSAWTWTNSFAYSFWKGIGVGFNFGLQQNKQERFNHKRDIYSNLNESDNKLQSFWMFGVSYAL